MSAVATSIPDAFARRVASGGGRLALRYGARELSYGALDQASSRLARAIVARIGAQPAGRVALLLDDPIRQLVGVLAVLRAGQAFVPLDVAQPPARLAQCVEDCQPALLLAELTTRELANELAGGRLALLDVEHEDAARTASLPAPRPDDVAFIQYTSGSTGRPKGVVQLHRSVLHNVRAYADELAVVPDDRFAVFGSYAFAAALAQSFRALLSGAAVLPYDVRRQGLLGLPEWLSAEEISVYASVPSLFRHWTAELSGRRRFPRLRLLSLGGEPVRCSDVRRFRELFPPTCDFVCSLGMTEQPSFRRLRLAHDAPLDGDLLPVGAAVAGTEVLLWDEQGRPVDPGAVGEIVLRSRFLSTGYWRQPELTREAFLDDPADPASRLFKTGDLGRLRPDGGLEHLGRRDGRLKIRGHRVEAAEVEVALLKTGDIRDAAVVARAGSLGDAELLAFVVPRHGCAPDGPSLRAALVATLPEPLIPARFVVRASLPLLPNGKLDRQALARVEVDSGGATAPSGGSRGDPVERELIDIWERFLGTRGIGARDDFFDLGGNSLLAARIIARIQRELSLSLPLATLYQARTVERLAQALRRKDGLDAGSPCVPLQSGGKGPTLFCLPGAGTDAAAFSHLALHLGAGQPLCALQWPGLCDEHQPDSVEALAAWFLQHVRRRQPSGPYLLAGFSFGGLVAFELAQQLLAQGHSVALLALLDTSCPDARPRRDSWSPRRLARRWFLPSGARHYGGRWTLRQLRLGLLERLGEARFRLDRALHPGRRAPPPAWRSTWVRELCLLASRRYAPRPYAGALAVFRNERQPPDDPGRAAADLGWSALARGALHLRGVPGAHGDALSPPNVAFLARELWPLLLELRPAEPAREPALYT